MRVNSGRIASMVVLVAGTSMAAPGDWPQWRGPHRDGLSEETGLLRKWPEEGPKLIWQVEDLGAGFSTPSVVDGRIYVQSSKGAADEFVQARDAKDGRQIWSTRIGKVGNPEQRPSYPGARSTPTVEGGVLYALGSDGDLASLDARTGEVRWRKSFRGDFDGKPGTWAYSESPLLDGDVLVCTPGGSTATLVAIDKKSGAMIWKCALPEGDNAAYASPIVVEAGGIRQYVQLLEKGLVGVEAKSGRFLWRYAKPVSRFNANIPTPLAGDGLVYVGSAGTGGGAVKLRAEKSAIQAEEVYFGSKWPTSIGGSVKIGDFLYGTTGQAMLCLEFATGDVKWQERALGAASICYAEGRLYLHGENGEVALVEATPEGYRELGRFTPPKQPERPEGAKAWAHPVLAGGRLYIRDVDSLWCYDVSAPGAAR